MYVATVVVHDLSVCYLSKLNSINAPTQHTNTLEDDNDKLAHFYN